MADFNMYSFDVFDTLITRCTATPRGIFMLMQEIIKEKGKYASFISDNFYELRVGAEELARAEAVRKGKNEITLDSIYIALASTACITKEQQEELKQLEVSIECKNIQGISKNIDMLKNIKSQGEHVVLISDMYLEENIIRHMLCQIDSVFTDIPIYVSSNYGATKASGELFRIVRNQENVKYSRWVHYGDNISSDIESPSRLGIKAIHLIAENAKEYERPQKDLYHQISIGASRYIRNSMEAESLAGEIGCSLGGPILYPYISWVLKESMRRGLKRLYFVARDGWILQQIADIIIRIRKYPIKTYYIYGSRKVWRLPAYDGSVEEFDAIVQGAFLNESYCLNDLAKVVHLDTKELKGFLPQQYKGIEEKQYLPKLLKNNICKQLRENSDFRSYLLKKQADNRAKTIKYLRQEMDFSDDKYAFVELYGTGFTQKCLGSIIESFYDGKIRNFYFRLERVQTQQKCGFINFYPSNMNRGHMIELLCRAPYGQTEAYTEKDGKIVPVLEKFEGEKIKAYGIEDYKTGVCGYVEQMEHTYLINNLDPTEQIDIIHEYMNVITKKPSKRIAQYFCHMPFSSNGDRNAIIEFAPDVTYKQLRKIYFWNEEDKLHQVYHGNCLDYAFVVSNKAEQYKKKCLKYRESYIGKWLVYCNRYLRTHQKPGTDFFCPWEFLRGNIVIYGAGKVGQAYVKQARQKHAQCEDLLWVDKNYAKLQRKGFDVKAPEEIETYFFDRIIIAIHNDMARQEVWTMLCEMGVEAGKIYYG